MMVLLAFGLLTKEGLCGLAKMPATIQLVGRDVISKERIVGLIRKCKTDHREAVFSFRWGANQHGDVLYVSRSWAPQIQNMILFDSDLESKSDSMLWTRGWGSYFSLGKTSVTASGPGLKRLLYCGLSVYDLLPPLASRRYSKEDLRAVSIEQRPSVVGAASSRRYFDVFYKFGRGKREDVLRVQLVERKVIAQSWIEIMPEQYGYNFGNVNFQFRQ